MHIKTILSGAQTFNSLGYGKVRWIEKASELTIETRLRPSANGRTICSGCQRRRPGYDTLPVRRFQFIPVWGIQFFLIYAPRRECRPDCGIVVERMAQATV
jgi:hypothetical protein